MDIIEEYINKIEKPIESIKGVGSKKSALFAKLGIHTIGELVHFFPRSYDDRSKIYTVSDAPNDAACCVRATVIRNVTERNVKKGITLYIATAADKTGSLTVKWFSSPYNRGALKRGAEYIFYGTLKPDSGLSRSMDIRLFEPPDVNSETGKIIPIYPSTAGLTQKDIRKFICSALDELGIIPDTLPNDLLFSHRLKSKDFAIRNIHFPQSEYSYAEAKKRLSFEELFVLSITLGLIKNSKIKHTDIVAKNVKITSEFAATLPFELTADQKKCVNDICADLKSGRPMNRLLQGDVGSGKTAVAACAAYVMSKNGYQTALMAPTEILASQHYKTLCSFFAESDINIKLLTGSSSGKGNILSSLKDGSCDVVVGTHALIEKKVEFANLGLCITDEQHRFGVRQRSDLMHGTKYPHVLVMSATPIPRTLSLILYGDLDLSVIKTSPKGRLPVETFFVGSGMHERIYSFMKENISSGHQCFVVCPLVEESENLDASSSTEVYKKLTEVFGNENVALIHGKMPPSQKDDIMNRFKDGDYDVLVATTVIEVGIDIPNANIIVIENSERFGLSQLHQLRGRVGRGTSKSYCILVSDSKSDECRQRMKVMCSTNDGFKIAEEDLQMRGCGEFFGTRQHGLPELKIANIFENPSELADIRKLCDDILKNDPNLDDKAYRYVKARAENIIESSDSISVLN